MADGRLRTIVGMFRRYYYYFLFLLFCIRFYKMFVHLIYDVLSNFFSFLFTGIFRRRTAKAAVIVKGPPDYTRRDKNAVDFFVSI